MTPRRREAADPLTDLARQGGPPAWPIPPEAIERARVLADSGYRCTACGAAGALTVVAGTARCAGGCARGEAA